jgi:hypothetical protein
MRPVAIIAAMTPSTRSLSHAFAPRVLARSTLPVPRRDDFGSRFPHARIRAHSIVLAPGPPAEVFCMLSLLLLSPAVAEGLAGASQTPVQVSMGALAKAPAAASLGNPQLALRNGRTAGHQPGDPPAPSASAKEPAAALRANTWQPVVVPAGELRGRLPGPSGPNPNSARLSGRTGLVLRPATAGAAPLPRDGSVATRPLAGRGRHQCKGARSEGDKYFFRAELSPHAVRQFVGLATSCRRNRPTATQARQRNPVLTRSTSGSGGSGASSPR